MNEHQTMLASAPIVEAVVDIDCDMPNRADVDALDVAAAAALADCYPTQRRRMLSEHQISTAPDQALAVTSRQGLQALQYFSADDKQLIQFRPAGFSFNRLAPYTSLDDYLAEIERTWRIFVDIARPVVCRAIRLRYINRIQLPMVDGRVEIDDYLKLAPKLADEERLSFAGFFNPDPLSALWDTADREIGLERRVRAAAVLTAADVWQAKLDVESHEPPPRHANIAGWPSDARDPEKMRAQRKELALLLAQAAKLVHR